MYYRGFYTTKEHLEELSEIRNSTPWYMRLIQRYNMPPDFPYVFQIGSHIASPCISVVSLSIDGNKLSIISLENQSEGMPTAKPVNFKTDISIIIVVTELIKYELIHWKSPVFGWSKRNWLSLTLSNGESCLIGVHELPKQTNNRKTKKIMEALSAL